MHAKKCWSIIEMHAKSVGIQYKSIVCVHSYCIPALFACISTLLQHFLCVHFYCVPTLLACIPTVFIGMECYHHAFLMSVFKHKLQSLNSVGRALDKNAKCDLHCSMFPYIHSLGMHAILLLSICTPG